MVMYQDFFGGKQFILHILMGIQQFIVIYKNANGEIDDYIKRVSKEQGS
jgi:hypothetical protein